MSFSKFSPSVKEPGMCAFRLCCVLLGIVAWSCLGQSDRGSITGRVVDPTDSLVLNAAITVLSQDTGARTVAHTNGAGSTSPESGGLLFTYPPLEAIGEFKLSSSVFSAEFGKTGGGFEIFTTRSGTNKYHGAAFEYLRNDKFDARGFIAQTTPVNRQ